MSHWIVPGIFGPLPRGSDPPPLLQLGKLERILGRARRFAGPKTSMEALGDLFGLGLTTKRAVATAPLSYLGETGEAPEQWLCFAHPVILQPDQDRLLLFKPEVNALPESHRRELLERFNKHFAVAGLRLTSPGGACWYLNANDHHGVAFSDLEEVAGRNIDPFLPTGPDQTYWRRLLNETQMLLYDLPLNEQRVERGLPPISGLWFSGGGRLPRSGKPRVRCATGGSSVLAGLCRLTGVAQCDLHKAIEDNGLILVDGPLLALLAGDTARWLTELERLEERFAKLGAVSLNIYPCDGQTFKYTPGWRNLWRQPLRLRDLLSQDQTP